MALRHAGYPEQTRNGSEINIGGRTNVTTSTTSDISFGTDGWRAIIAEEFTFENVRVCAKGVSRYLQSQGTAGQGVIVGYDTRFGSERFAAAIAEVLAADGIPVYLCQTWAPTPTVSFTVVDRKAAGAIIVTASHNPPEWNGFKYKPEYGGSASPEVIAAVEREIHAAEAAGKPITKPLHDARRDGIVMMIDPRPTYFDRLRSLVDIERIKSAGLRVVIDPMYGAGMGYLIDMLSGGETELMEIHGERNPAFPGMRQPEPIAHNLGELRETVVRYGCSVGLATDGDADRVGGVDERGRFLTPLQFFALLAFYLLEIRGERGALVKSITSSRMIDLLGEKYEVPVYEEPVGFKYVGPRMMETNALIGGEESGGFGFRGHVPERDGVLSALYILDAMARTGRSLSGLVDWLYETVGPHYYDRLDLEFPATHRTEVMRSVQDSQPTNLAGVAVADVTRTDGFRFTLEDGSWLLLRFSGTEPLLRIYAEARSMERVQRLIGAGRDLTGV